MFQVIQFAKTMKYGIQNLFTGNFVNDGENVLEFDSIADAFDGIKTIEQDLTNLLSELETV